MSTGIHPAPARFTNSQIATDPILHFFHYAHLPAALQSASKPFCDLAEHIVTTLPAPKLEDRDTAAVASQEIGEPREVGGFDEDRDGPVPFRS